MVGGKAERKPRVRTFPSGVPRGFLTVREASDIIGVTTDAVYAAVRSDRLEGVKIRDRICVKDVGLDGLRSAFPIAWRPAEIEQLFQRWMTIHDIRSIGERAVRETA